MYKQSPDGDTAHQDFYHVFDLRLSALNQLYQFVTTDNRLQTVAAIKNNQVYLIDSNLVSRPGPRVVSALQYFAQIIHPEIFGEYQNQEINSK